MKNNLITNLFITGMLVVAFVGWDVAHTKTPRVEAQDAPKAPVVTQEASPSAQVIPSDIVDYIEYKFKDKAVDALTVLQGKGVGTCAENRTLDPNETNDNTLWGGVGKDVGYWQINTVYHPTVTEWCARDVKCSTDYAFKLSKGGTNFSAWTCGREYGI